MRVYRSLRRRRKHLGEGRPRRPYATRWPVLPGRQVYTRVTRAEEEPEDVPKAVLLARMRAIKLSKRERAKIKRGVNRALGLRRRELGAIGAGHVDTPEGYKFALALGQDIARFRRLEEEQ